MIVFVHGVPETGELWDKVRSEIEVLEGVGHWWAYQDPKGAAVVMQRFWDSLK